MQLLFELYLFYIIYNSRDILNNKIILKELEWIQPNASVADRTKFLISSDITWRYSEKKNQSADLSILD